MLLYDTDQLTAIKLERSSEKYQTYIFLYLYIIYFIASSIRFQYYSYWIPHHLWPLYSELLSVFDCSTDSNCNINHSLKTQDQQPPQTDWLWVRIPSDVNCLSRLFFFWLAFTFSVYAGLACIVMPATCTHTVNRATSGRSICICLWFHTS